MRLCRGILAAVAVGLAGAAGAQTTECSHETTQMAMNACAFAAYARADADLTDAYAAARAGLIDEAGQRLLRDAQRTWIPFRDAACAAEADQVRGGSMAPMVQGLCLTRLTQTRANDLWTMAR
jgi:uncharacterized protein YecT (DUF1311 family)